MNSESSSRRPLKSRDVPLFRAMAAWMARRGFSPDVISFSSIVFGIGAGGALALTDWTDGGVQRELWFLAALLIQLRLLANMLDGMVAVEGGRGGPTGELWNEAPDRLADIAIFIGAGYAAGSDPRLGFGAALAAVCVAYVRALGAGVGAGQIFLGPQAKPHRMALLTGALVVTAVFPAYSTEVGLQPSPLIFLTLVLVILGCTVTIYRRLKAITAYLRTKRAA